MTSLGTVDHAEAVVCVFTLGVTDLEAVCLEILEPNSRPFVIASVYRPRDSSLDIVTSFENLVKAIDNEDK